MKHLTLLLTIALTLAAVTVGAQDFYVFAGQSNMSGSGKAEDLTINDLDTVDIWGWDWVQNKFVTDLNPIANDDVFRAELLHGYTWDRNQKWGCVLEAMRVIRDRTGEPVYFIKYAWGGSAILPTHNGTTNWSNDLYDTLEAEVALTGRTPTAFMWMQGETEAITQARADQYETLLPDFIDRVKAEICSGPFIAGHVQLQNLWTYAEQVRALQLSLNQSGDLKLVSSDDFKTYIDDPAHFDAASLRKLGLKFALQALYGHTTTNSKAYPETCGDYDGDGHIDALWAMRSGSDRIFKIWRMVDYVVKGQDNLYWNGAVMDRVNESFRFVNSVDVDNDNDNDIYHTDGTGLHIWRIDYPNVTHSKWIKE